MHHHHLHDGSVVFHTHPEDLLHGIRLLSTNSEGWAVNTVDSRSKVVPECSTRLCPLRRHDG